MIYGDVAERTDRQTERESAAVRAQRAKANRREPRERAWTVVGLRLTRAVPHSDTSAVTGMPTLPDSRMHGSLTPVSPREIREIRVAELRHEVSRIVRESIDDRETGEIPIRSKIIPVATGHRR